MATEIGDIGLVLRSHLHFVYLDIQEGLFDSAAERIRRLTWCAKAVGVSVSLPL